MSAARKACAAMLLSSLLLGAARPCAAEPDRVAGLRTMAQQLQLDQARLLIVQHHQRYKILDSFAREVLADVHGRGALWDLDPLVVVLELTFDPGSYVDEPIIRIRNPGLRQHLTAHLPVEQAMAIRKTGLVSYRFLTSESVTSIVQELSGRSYMVKAINQFGEARFCFESLASLMNVVPDPQGSWESPWLLPEQLLPNVDPPEDIVRTHGGQRIPGVSREQAAAVLRPWLELQQAWLARDADSVNAALAELVAVLPAMAPPGLYPEPRVRQVEYFYNRMHKFTPVWIVYTMALFASVFALLTRFRWARWSALALFLVAWIGHAAGLAVRWYILGRIPIANQFESVVGSACLGCVLALILELIYRRGIFLLAGSFLGFLSLSMGSWLGSLLAPGFRGGELETIPAILDDLMLRIHTVLIVASYSAIILAFAVAVVYLIVYAWARPEPGYGYSSADASGIMPHTTGAAGWLAWLDRGHMVLLYIMFIALFVGIILGAMWADYSWGRPWGWDPKEVFALNTWLVYTILIHLRFVTKRRGLWTAVLSVCGFVAMMFNWWVVNFHMVGLHSYA